jgi:hypothetical protein
MFRRIELIGETSVELHDFIIKDMQEHGDPIHQRDLSRFWKSGLMGGGASATATIPVERAVPVAEAWHQLKAPRRALFKNCRFYFTETGWRRYGRPTVRALQQTGQKYRVIRINEHSVEVVYRDEFQVAVRPKKKKDSSRTRGSRRDHGEGY